MRDTYYDERLGNRAEALHGLAAKVPAFRVLADAVDRLRASSPAEAAHALLDLVLLLLGHI